MKQIQVNWNKVSPADLSSTFCAQFFAFSKNNEVLLVDEVNEECLFTKVIQASAGRSKSLYDMDIWVGSIESGRNNINENFDSKELMDVLEWSAKVQLLEAEQEKEKLKKAEDQKITKRTRLRMLASIA